MFLGHFALGFAGKHAAPATSLGTLFVAAQLADLLWPNFVLLHAEHVEIVPGATTVTPLELVSYPYSHSLIPATSAASSAAAAERQPGRLVGRGDLVAGVVGGLGRPSTHRGAVHGPDLDRMTIGTGYAAARGRHVRLGGGYRHL